MLLPFSISPGLFTIFEKTDPAAFLCILET